MRLRTALLGLTTAVALPATLAVAQVTAPPAAPAAPAAPATPANTANQPPFVVPFTRGGTSIDNNQEPILDRAVAYAQSNRTMGVVITGIADARGSDSARANRARAMATSVRNYLRDRGIPESRSRTAAEGDASPTAINRVEITFVPMR